MEKHMKRCAEYEKVIADLHNKLDEKESLLNDFKSKFKEVLKHLKKLRKYKLAFGLVQKE